MTRAAQQRPAPGVDASLALVRQAVRKVRPGIALAALRPNASLMRDLGLDSLRFAELSLALEAAFARPVFLVDLLAEVEDPSSLTLEQVARFLSKPW